MGRFDFLRDNVAFDLALEGCKSAREFEKGMEKLGFLFEGQTNQVYTKVDCNYYKLVDAIAGITEEENDWKDFFDETYDYVRGNISKEEMINSWNKKDEEMKSEEE